MRDDTTVAELQARVADLERRLGWAEQRITGEIRTIPGLHNLTSLYVNACRSDPPTQQLLDLWSVPLFSLGTYDLLQMARLMRDPFPWKPFLVMLIRYQDEGLDARPLLQHIWDRAQELLDLQGLGLLRPGDVMGYPIQIKEAIRTIST